MVHKITASLLAALMVLVAMSRYQQLSYCLSQEKFFIYDCPSSKTVATEVSSCECCSKSNKTKDDTPKIERVSEADCCIDLVFAKDQVWVESESLRLSDEKTHPVDLVWTDTESLKASISCSITTIRGPPPASPDFSPVPLHIRHSIFLL